MSDPTDGVPGRHALFAGTFDPPTLGHLDIVLRAARLFGRVTVGVAQHPSKTALFEDARRVALFRSSVEEAEGRPPADVRVVPLAGLVVQACEELGCDVLVRGVRSGTDYDYEAQMAATNRALLPRIDTVLLATSPALAHVSSTLVRQVARMGGDASGLVPPAVARALREHFGR